MKRIITIELQEASTVDNVEVRELANDVGRFMADQLGFESATVTLHGQRGRGGWKTETATV